MSFLLSVIFAVEARGLEGYGSKSVGCMREAGKFSDGEVIGQSVQAARHNSKSGVRVFTARQRTITPPAINHFSARSFEPDYSLSMRAVYRSTSSASCPKRAI